MTLREQLGDIDIYLLDQVLRGRIAPGMTLFDAGCGGGRNLVYFLRNGYRVFAVDEDPRAVHQVRLLAAQLQPELPEANIRTASLTEIPFPDSAFDVVIASAVLHFARDEAQFHRMLDEMWRVLAVGGVFFARLASTIGIERLVHPIQGRRFHLPDGSERFLVDEAMLDEVAERLGGRWLDPLKTTVVQNQRSMSTWVLRKEAGPAGKGVSHRVVPPV
jgi:SAM-dependent methyltransferase